MIMNKAHFQSMFNSSIGFVYEYLGSIPKDTDLVAHITQELIASMETDAFSIVVTETQTKTVVYTNNPAVVTNEEFVVLTDLTPETVAITETV